MSGVNKVILVGNLVRIPSSGISKVVTWWPTLHWLQQRFTATRTETRLITQSGTILPCGGKLANIAGKLLRKGSKVYLEGKIKSRSWEDKEGNKRYVTEIICRQLYPAGS